MSTTAFTETSGDGEKIFVIADEKNPDAWLASTFAVEIGGDA